MEYLEIELVWETDPPPLGLPHVTSIPVPYTVEWIVGSVVDSPCQTTLRKLRLMGHYYTGPAGVAAYARLATLPALRCLYTRESAGVEEMLMGVDTQSDFLPDELAVLRILLPRVLVPNMG